jgi:DNA-binding transcriptional ArsR family regulator
MSRTEAASVATIFAALGDPTRAHIVGRLAREGRLTLTDLARDAPISRQAMRRHVGVLNDAGIVAAERQGREVRLSVRPEALAPVGQWLTEVSRAWDDALSWLAVHLEGPNA